MTGEGAVTIRHRDMRLVADRVVYHELTKDVVADGNVVLDSGSDRLQGEHLELNLETRIGFLEHAQGFLQTYYFTGERIEKRGPDHYFLRGGSFTTCEGVLPDWSFHATSTEVTVDEYLHAWNPTLRIKKLPVLYFPYAVFPIKRDRSTGLLIPDDRHQRAPTASRSATRSTGRRATTSTPRSGSTTWRRPAGGPAARCATCWRRARRGSSPSTTCATPTPTPSAGRSRPATPRSCRWACTRRSRPSSRATGSSS